MCRIATVVDAEQTANRDRQIRLQGRVSIGGLAEAAKAERIFHKHLLEVTK